MRKYTQGKWEAYLPGRKFVQTNRNFNSICELNDFERSPEEVDANAYLIAAAPDLLDACRGLVYHWPTNAISMRDPRYGMIENLLTAARAAIAKAEGADA